MYCKNCKNEVNAKAEICTKCGCRVKKDREGLAIGLLLGLIGLIIGLLAYPSGSVQRSTFVKYCIIGWLFSVVISVTFFITYADLFMYYI